MNINIILKPQYGLASAVVDTLRSLVLISGEQCGVKDTNNGPSALLFLPCDRRCQPYAAVNKGNCAKA